MNAMRRMKMMEKEIAKLDGQVILLEMEKSAIESKSYMPRTQSILISQ